MLLPEAKEREHRFKLALRMGLPIFSLAVILVFTRLSEYFNTIPVSFYIIALLVLAVMIYYIFYLIYRGFDERITDPITHTFTREYLLGLFEKSIKKGPYTIILITVDNLHDINQRYGTQNGDKVLYETAQWIGEFLKSKGIQKFPIGHFKGGDFLIGLEGEKVEHKTLLELMCLKFEQYNTDEMEIQISGSIVDSGFSKNINHLTERLFELQTENRKTKSPYADEMEINPSEVETSVINAIKSRKFSILYQVAECKTGQKLYEMSVKLYGSNGKLIHQKVFIPVINRLGLAREFDTIMLELMVEECAKHDNGMFALTLFPSSIRNGRFHEKVQVIFSNNKSVEGRIVFVLGEQEYYSNTTRFRGTLDAYRRMGIRIALDRYGIYQTTLLYLKEYEIDMIRYDAHFVKHLKDKGAQSIVKGLDVAAKELGVKTWMKMIEDKETEEIAKAIGIDCLQGNLIGKIDTIEKLGENG